eukprot:TRINITY_DN7578_c0_g1_i1.p1 TRINITY_DN7578_c0_g1~~TRINITY_DN7578_c0_g1_i1.p1  ORF type:complete len:126 (+),score=15.49 TRINITY_DN7578_c0_g1_i1:2-379(+)
MIRRPPRSTPIKSSAASDVYKRQVLSRVYLRTIFYSFCSFLAWILAYTDSKSFPLLAMFQIVELNASVRISPAKAPPKTAMKKVELVLKTFLYTEETSLGSAALFILLLSSTPVLCVDTLSLIHI